MTAESAKDKNGAGLFAAVGEKGEFTFQDVRLINAQVKAGDNAPVGALVGSAANAAFDNCWVYWEMGSQNELRERLTVRIHSPPFMMRSSHFKAHSSPRRQPV